MIRIAVIGLGAIGRTHVDAIASCEGFTLAGALDADAAVTQEFSERGLHLYDDINELISDAPDGAIIATPNALHVDIGLELVVAGIPILVEKPIANLSSEGERLARVASEANVNGLVGHQRRYNPIIRSAKSKIADGSFGRLVVGQVTCTLYKPDSYFAPAWRREPGNGGPVLINLIHEIDLLRYFFGQVIDVTAISSDAVRGFEVEDTAAAILRFRDGGLVTLSVSDAAVGPWAWDLTAGENSERFPAHDAVSHIFSGSLGAFSLPDLSWWQHDWEKDWTKKLQRSAIMHGSEDSYLRQLMHFGDVISGKAEPEVSLHDGVENLRVVEALKTSAMENRTVRIDAQPPIGPSIGLLEKGDEPCPA